MKPLKAKQLASVTKTLTAVISGAVLLALSAGSTFAAEGGSSFYLLGQRGQGAGVLPPVEGVFFALPNYLYSGDASASRGLPIGGAVTFGVDADIFLTMPTAIWVTSADLFGGDLAFSGTFVYGNADLNAKLALDIPGIIQGEVALSDDYFIERKLYPNVDFYSGLVYKALGFPTNMFTVLFAIGRMPGWIAHWKEMRQDPRTRINRPRQIYTGPQHQEFIPLADR